MIIMRILVFLHGTLIMHKNARGHTREEIVKQVMESENSVCDYASYIPIGNVVKKLLGWKNQGVEICYLSSHENAEDVEKDKFVLEKYGFPKGQVLYRQNGEGYNDIVERMSPLPNIIIEDDCKSIGGEPEMTYPNLKPSFKSRIESIIVKEFGGIDHLPDNINDL